jgi:carbamoyltransferase
MPELILAIHHGPHDAAAAVLVDYELKAAVQVERLSRVKGDGSYPDLSIEETLDMVGRNTARCRRARAQSGRFSSELFPPFPRLALVA